MRFALLVYGPSYFSAGEDRHYLSLEQLSFACEEQGWVQERNLERVSWVIGLLGRLNVGLRSNVIIYTKKKFIALVT